jgi:hypothetical protein
VSRDVIWSVSDLSKPPEPLFENNQEPVVPISTSKQGSINQEAPEIISFRSKLFPRYPKLTRITRELVNYRALLVTNQNIEAFKISLLIKEAFSSLDTYF